MLLLASPALSSLPSPETKAEVSKNSSAVAPAADSGETVVATTEVPAFTSVLEKLPAGKSFVGAGLQTASPTATGVSALPPLPPRIGKKWKARAGEAIPHDEFAYFPVSNYA